MILSIIWSPFDRAILDFMWHTAAVGVGFITLGFILDVVMDHIDPEWRGRTWPYRYGLNKYSIIKMIENILFYGLVLSILVLGSEAILLALTIVFPGFGR